MVQFLHCLRLTDPVAAGCESTGSRPPIYPNLHRIRRRVLSLGLAAALLPLISAAQSISGRVYEDANYGGGAGRNYSGGGGFAGCGGARVELYNMTLNPNGVFVASTTTANNGNYSFTGPAVISNNNYRVRVVNSTVVSERPGAVAGLLPVQTYVRNDVNRVGGEAPQKVDAPAVAGTQNVTIRLVGLNPGGGDNTAFVDQVSVVGAAGVVLNPSFETPSQGGGYSYATPGASWTFVGAGIAAFGSAFAPPAPPNGTQVAFIQGVGTASQTVALTPGAYTISLRVAQRACCTTNNNQRIAVQVNGVTVGTAQPTVGSGYATLNTSSFNVAPVATLNSLNTSTTIAQSQALVTATNGNVSGVNFGFNFDVVCNTNDSGQGSLRQFIVNSNTLTNVGLAQVGQTAGRESSLFMIPSGVAVPGLRSSSDGIVNQLTGPVDDARAIIALPVNGATLEITDVNTTIDGTTQTARVGDTNTGTLGSTEAVGIDALAVVPVNQPEVEITGNTGVTTMLQLTGANSIVRGISIRGGSRTINVTGTGYLVENNVIGTSAIAYQWENNATVSTEFGIGVQGTAVGTIQNNLIGYTGNSGVDIDNGVATAGITTLQGNQFNQNGYTSAGGDGISLGDSGGSGQMLIQGNLFTRSNSSAVQFEIQTTAVSQVRNNTMVSCGKGGAGSAQSSLEGSAICYLQRDGTKRGTQADVISRNVIVDTQASAIVVGYGQSNVKITENSIYNSGSLAIDLVFNPNAYVGGPGLGATEYGSGDGVDLNDGVVSAPSLAPPNRGTDYPVLVSLDVLGANMIVDGFCRPGATIEFFVAATDPTRFGEGRTFLYSRVEGSGTDTDAGTGAYGPAAVNYLLQGQDASAARFTFTLPFTSLASSVQAAILTNGLTSTATLNANTSEFSGDATLRADVYSTITPVASPTGGGATAQFSVVFGNAGPSTANGVVAVVQLPAGLSGVVVSGSGTYSSLTGLVTYAAITLTAGQTVASTISYTQPIDLGAVTGTTSISTTTNENGLYANNVSTSTLLTGPRFDLTTTLDGPATTAAGQLVTYGVITTNLGPTTAPGVEQTVQLPTGLLDVFATNGGSYDAATGLVTFPAIAGLASGQRRNNAVAFLAPAATFNLTADVTPLAGDINTANNTTATPLTTTVTGPAGALANVYALVASNAPATGVAPGAAVTFTVQQGNDGPQPATNVVTRLALTPGLTGVVLSGGGTYNTLTGMVTWPAVASQATATAQAPLTATVNAPSAGLLTATASVAASTADPVPANNVATTEVTITNANITDIRLTLAGPARAVAGQPIVYTVTTTNAGLNPALDVVPSMELPTGLSGVVVSGGGTYSATTGTVTFPTTASLVPGGILNNTITFNTPLNDATSLPVAAGVFTASAELNPGNNLARVSTLLQAYADVEVRLAGPATSTVGSGVTYVVTTVNNGPAVSNGHTLTVQLPSGLGGVAVVGGGTYNMQSGVVTFPAITNQLPDVVGAVVRTISFVVPDRAFVTPTAAVTITGNDDPVTTNNLAVLATAIATPTVLRADVSTTVTSNVATQTAGLPISFTVGVANAGPDRATGGVLQLALRPGLTGVGVSTGGAYNTLTGIVSWSLPDINNGSSTTRTVTVNAPGISPLVASAIVTATETDLVTTNNRATTTVAITPSADVTISVNGRSVTEPNVMVVYSVTTLNNGPSPAIDVAQTVQLPTGLAGVIVTGGGSYNAGTGVVTFPTIASQPIGSSGVVTNTITFTFPATPYTVVGTVTTTTNDPLPLNNSDSQLTTPTVNRQPVAFDVVSTLQAPRGETSTVARPLSPLRATDSDGSVASYRVLTLVPATQGVVTLGGVPLTLNQVLSPTQAGQLAFRPTAGFVGNAFFSYLAVDNSGARGNTALVTIPVGRDNASVYTNAPVQGGSGNPYQNNEDIATVFDANGGEYATGPVVTDNGTRSAFLASGSNPLPAGVALDAVTGRLFVSNATLLVVNTYTVTITTIDEFAGETTQPVTFVIGGTPLPVELMSFTAKTRGRVADLAWLTASEKNSAWFVVERSLDGRTFRELGRVAAAGTTTEARTYAWTDEAPAAGLSYYRLRQVDLDGTFAYSEVRAVRFGAVKATVAIWPNPFTDRVTVDLTAYAATETVELSLFNATGQLVQRTALPGGSATQQPLTGLPAGTYLVRLASPNGETVTMPLVRE